MTDFPGLAESIFKMWNSSPFQCGNRMVRTISSCSKALTTIAKKKLPSYRFLIHMFFSGLLSWLSMLFKRSVLSTVAHTFNPSNSTRQRQADFYVLRPTWSTE